MPFVIYVDFESILEITATCDNNPEVSWTTKMNNYPACSSILLLL